MNKELKKVVISSTIVLVTLLSIDIIVGLSCDYITRNLPIADGGQLAKQNYRLNHVSADMVIIGSSRASHHYIPKVLEDSLKTIKRQEWEVYNAGIDGKYISSSCFTIKSILDRYTPHTIVLEVNDNELLDPDVSDVRFATPHYTSNKVVKDYINRIGVKEQVLCMSGMYRYNGGKLFRLLRTMVSSSGISDIQGYEPLYKKLQHNDTSESITTQTKQKADPYHTNNFVNLLKRCQAENINLVVVSSPRFRPNDTNGIVRAYCKEYSTPYVDLYNIPLFNQRPEWFQDESHLNDVGAKVFTVMFFNKIRDLKVLEYENSDR
ncbi:hypothetical protein [Porphyromonas levii]|uniref:hypothetical protein n=1 Tax=Porphyromonas levii TaxID=28114 RepID=UPI001B8C5303|nr:hypothetical protein [Porphyromonas levii]MBR8769042.1 hypothetical protein [Porphyromonas levii]